jgi:membrane fusion protein (multidrug efflux system)
VTVRGLFDNLRYQKYGDFYLVPGQYVPVVLTVGETPDALVIPQTAIVETQAGQAVYVVGDDKKVEHRSIKTGATHEQSVVVTEGLKAGEKVVAVGVQKVKQGIEVEPTAPAKPDSSAKQDS